MTATFLSPENSVAVLNDCFAIGPIDHINELPEQTHLEELAKLTNSTQIGVCKRASVGRQIMHSLQYTRSKKRNNYTISYTYRNMKFHGDMLAIV